MNQPTIEIVTFKLAPGANETAFLVASEDISSFLKSCSGFVRRRLSKSEDGTWLDHVEWQSLAEARQADEKIMSTEMVKPFMALIDAESIRMRHDALHLRTD